MTAKKPTHPLVPADRVNGTDVYDKAGEKLGKIEDIVIEKVSGQVAYAILAYGGVLGLGSKYYPMPWKALKYDEHKRAYVAPITQGDLEKAPVIDASRLSGWSDAASREEIHSFYAGYGIGPFWL